MAKLLQSGFKTVFQVAGNATRLAPAITGLNVDYGAGVR